MTNTLELIEKHGLSVRQIPVKVTSRWRVWQEPEKRPKLREDETESIIDGKLYRIQTKYPKHGGYWMTKISGDSSCLIRWSLNDFLAPTLSESVALCVAAYFSEESTK